MSFKLFKLKQNKEWNRSRKKLGPKKSRVNRFTRSIVMDFCGYTNLHGFNSLLQEIQSNPSPASRIGFVIWLASILCGIFFTIYLIALVLERYRIHPTIMTIETNYLETWQVDFPGVTICNVNSIYKPKTHKLTEEL